MEYGVNTRAAKVDILVTRLIITNFNIIEKLQLLNYPLKSYHWKSKLDSMRHCNILFSPQNVSILVCLQN